MGDVYVIVGVINSFNSVIVLGDMVVIEVIYKVVDE